MPSVTWPYLRLCRREFVLSLLETGGQCIEVSDDFAVIVSVRGSKNPDGPAFAFPADGWPSFVSVVKVDGLNTWTRRLAALQRGGTRDQLRPAGTARC
jgi:hypothetical protein